MLAEAGGYASPAELEALAARPAPWEAELRRLVAETERGLERARRLAGPERAQVVSDFEAERANLVAALARLTGQAEDLDDPDDAARGEDDHRGPATTGRAVLQLSWKVDKIVAWGGGPGAPRCAVEDVRDLLATAGAPASGWEPHGRVPLPDGRRAEALAIDVADALGWLAAVGAGSHGDGGLGDPPSGGGEAGASVGWLGAVASWAVSLVADGQMVPSLRRMRHRRAGATAGTAGFAVRWQPALVDARRLALVSDALPGAAAVFSPGVDSREFTQTTLAGMVDAIARHAAARVEVPAPPPRPQSPADVADSFLGHLDGEKFDLPAQAGGELAGRLERWARPVSRPSHVRLAVRLDPPDAGEAWQLSVHALGVDPSPVPVEVALVTAQAVARREVEEHLIRLERLLPVLRRPGGARRGEVVLSGDEAWDLMARTGDTLAAAGFEVRVPALSRRRPLASLRLFADSSQPSVVGAQQLAQVRWSALFDDVELTAADIARLSQQARPLVLSRGRWVALDHLDLAEAAAALAERSKIKQLSGAEMLRHALGLEGSALAGGITVDGEGWAADLLRAASGASRVPASTPHGFHGDLRTYQAEALAWLGFLDEAGLGGCLALDMGLGKTPTLLAHVLASAGRGPVLVIAPPAVVGNWAAEAARFTPGLRVVVHHGSDRVSPSELTALAESTDVVITTYGTAVRDVEALSDLTWDRVIVDEAQAMKNPASDTAQQLRRIPARSRVALTGTPIENGLGDLWSVLDFTNPGLVGSRPQFVSQLSGDGNTKGAAEAALRALNGLLVFRRTKAEPEIAAELPERIDELDHCGMTAEQIGLYQAVLDQLLSAGAERRQGDILAAITALKQICNHPAAYRAEGSLEGRSGKLTRLEEIVDAVFAAGERVLVFTHFAQWGQRLAAHLTARTGVPVACYDGSLTRSVRDRLVHDFQHGDGPGALVLSLKAGGTGLNLTAANHVVLYDRWWNPAVEDQARDRAWRIGQTKTVICHRLVCPGTVDERVEEVVHGKRQIAELVLPKSSTLDDLDADQLRVALGLRTDTLLVDAPSDAQQTQESAA